jgi:hypothetical protein
MYIVNLNGSLFSSYEISKSPDRIVLGNGHLYYFDILSEVLTLYEFSPESRSSKEIGQLANYRSVSHAEIIGEKLYFIGTNKDYLNKEYDLADINDRFSYSGEAICSINLITGDFDELPVEFPIAFSKTPDDKLILYAYDDEGGYHFIEYNAKKDEFSGKIYHKIEMVYKFVICNEKKDIVYHKVNNTMSLTLTSIYPDKGEIELDAFLNE